jgi:hypothetical protein
VGADHEAWAIERDLHRPVAIGPERRDATEGRERFRRGMTIPVPGPDRDERDLRPHRVDEGDRMWCRGAVVRRHVDARMQSLGMQQQVRERLIGRVTHEQRRETATLDAKDE